GPNVHPERVLNRQRFDKLARDRVGYRIIPAEVEPVVVVSVVGISLPVPRQPNGVRWVLEAAVEKELGMNSVLDASEHHLGELAVERRTDLSLNLRRVDHNARWQHGLATDNS
ncbi:MAG TPA: hypothetical protein VH209_11680, partial [Steroidobacteraceae bacterium]|nr:hypothetical protein [Steroidobacteraceae bacterium]